MEAIAQIIQENSFYQFAILLAMAAIGGILANLLKQPLIIAYIAIGVIAGPSIMGFVSAADEITLMSKLGIAILLFIVGLKLDIGLIKSLGKVSLIIGTGQMALTFAGAFAICLMLGMDINTATLVSVAMAFSSTIIIVKILSDKHEIDSMHGRIALGILIIQDIAVVIAMMVLATISASGTDQSDGQMQFWSELLKVGFSAALFVCVTAIFMRYAAHKLVRSIAHTPELLLCFAIGWAVLMAAVCDFAGLSKEMGGLMAGISLASTPFREAIISRLASLRDFLLLFFFMTLGIQLDIHLLDDALIPALILSVFVMVAKPAIIMGLTGYMGYRKRTSFLAGLSLAQISEFSLIFISMAYASNIASEQTLGLVTMVGLITIGLSTYGLAASHKIYGAVCDRLDFLERDEPMREKESEGNEEKKSYDVILFGLGRYGSLIAKGLKDSKKKLLLVDFNPDAVMKWREDGYSVVYGDASDPEFFHTLPLDKTNWVISALPQHDTGVTHEDPRLIILQGLKAEKYKGKVALAVHRQESAAKFKKAGADEVFLPFHDAAERAVNIILSHDKSGKK